EYVALTGLDRLRCAGGRLESRAAQPGHRLAGNLHRKARGQQPHPSHVAIVFARLIGAAEDHVVDGEGVDTGALHDRHDGNRGKIIRAHTGQGPAVFADGCTERRTDVCFGHLTHPASRIPHLVTNPPTPSSSPYSYRAPRCPSPARIPRTCSRR